MILACVKAGKLLSSIFLPVLISNFIFIRIWDMEMLIMETFRHHPF
ncbi:unknown [Phocaeicola coprophilus CAG:333]|nr:unknown [Phocaeicola coprophilus CAG:333]